MTTPENDPRNQVAQEPPFDPDYDQAPPAEGQPGGAPGEEPSAVDGQQAASGQPAAAEGQAQAEAQRAEQTPPQAPAQADSANGEEMLGATGDAQDGNLEKDPSDWVSGDDPATEAQKSYIDALAKQAGEQIPANLTKAEASEQIDRLKKITGN